MGNAWTMYLDDSRGRLPYTIWHTAPTGVTLTGSALNEFIWTQFWFGILNNYRVVSSELLCPEAQDPIPFNSNTVNTGITGGGSAAQCVVRPMADRKSGRHHAGSIRNQHDERCDEKRVSDWQLWL